MRYPCMHANRLKTLFHEMYQLIWSAMIPAEVTMTPPTLTPTLLNTHPELQLTPWHLKLFTLAAVLSPGFRWLSAPVTRYIPQGLTPPVLLHVWYHWLHGFLGSGLVDQGTYLLRRSFRGFSASYQASKGVYEVQTRTHWTSRWCEMWIIGDKLTYKV